jgi:hypothetical protein
VSGATGSTSALPNSLMARPRLLRYLLPCSADAGMLLSRLLIPVVPAAHLQAEADAQALQTCAMALQEMRSLAAWLTARLQLCQDVKACGVSGKLGALKG